ncbi:sugar phosphate isomerase/epimerase family protein [Sphingomonas gellani]|nr:sugar phosphate isomerase/epimerase [Sphingomonas gellani]
MSMPVDRRTLIGGAAAFALAPTGLLAAPRRRPRLGIQLYTLMQLLDRDLEGTIAQVAAMGYREVETLGSFGGDPVRLREIFDRHGLVSPSQHIMPPGLYEVFDAGVAKRIDMATFEREFIAAFSFDRVEGLIEACAQQAKALGQTYIVWQISWPSQLETRAKIDALVKALNRAADTAHREGFTLAYHNHSQEFTKVGTDVPYDLILKGTNPDRLKFEMDLAWATAAKVDPVGYFRRYPGRFRMVHMKDVGADGNVRDPGTGIVPFKRIIPAAEKAGVEHFYVEYDVPKDPMATAKRAYGYLSPLL